MFADCLLAPGPQAEVEVHLRFLQLQSRSAEEADDGGGFSPVDELTIGAARWLSWDEAVEEEVTLGPFSLAQLRDAGQVLPVAIPAGLDVEELTDGTGRVAGRLVRRRQALHGEVRLDVAAMTDGLLRLRVSAANTAPAVAAADTRPGAIAASFIGAHLLLSLRDGDFVSLLEPPDWAQAAARSCAQHRCWPVLAGPEGQTDVLLVSPIILYDHPAVAPESSVALYDSTEIDEILTLRVLTLTDEEKAEARATDPRAAAIIDRCEAMSADELQQLHGILRDPYALAGPPELDWPTAVASDGGGSAGSVLDGGGSAGSATGASAGGSVEDRPWWDPEADASVRPDTDAVVINGIPVARGSRVRVNPSRRADAQDLFFAGQTGRVTSVHFDVDGSTHVGLVLEQDPAADLHEGYGRSFYYAPEELEPLEPMRPATSPGTREGKEEPR